MNTKFLDFWIWFCVSPGRRIRVREFGAGIIAQATPNATHRGGSTPPTTPLARSSPPSGVGTAGRCAARRRGGPGQGHRKKFPSPGTILSLRPTPVDQLSCFPRWRRLSTKKVPEPTENRGTFPDMRGQARGQQTSKRGVHEKTPAPTMWCGRCKSLLAKLTTLNTRAAKHLAVLLLGHTLAALLNH